MRKAAVAFLAAWYVALPAYADIFKCPGPNGLDKYQNFPCPLDSLGSGPSKSQVSAIPPVSANAAAPRAAGRAVTTNTSVAQDGVRIGMTRDQVKATWGTPLNVYWDELVDGRVEIWSYLAARSVTFDLSGRVSAIAP